MTGAMEHTLDEIDRALDKAKMRGDQAALADWANVYGPELVKLTRKSDEALSQIGNEPGRVGLAALYPGVNAPSLFGHAANDIAAMRAERAKQAGYEPGVNGKHVALVGESEVVAALRPFAGLGAPVVIDAIKEIAASSGLAWNGEDQVTILDGEGAKLHVVTIEQSRRAYELINQIDGGAGS